MEETNKENILKSHIIDAIKSGEVKMRSRRYFLLRDILAILAIAIVLLIAVFFVSFIVFVLRQSGTWFVPIFGFAGWYALFRGLPWVLLGLSAIFIITLAILAKRYQFGYQWPLAYSLLGGFFLVVSMSFLFIRSSLYHGVFDSQLSQGIPFLDQYYPGIGMFAPGDIHRGEIEGVFPNGFVIQDIAEHTSTIVIVSSTNFPLGDRFKFGDIVVIFGDRSETGTIVAAGVEDLTAH